MSYCVFIVPELGTLKITTEFGKMVVSPGEICVIQVSIIFLKDTLVQLPSRTYIDI